jgi:hypothetical protein
MSFRDFLLLSVTATIIAIAPALHPPPAESLSVGSLGECEPLKLHLECPTKAPPVIAMNASGLSPR